MPQIIKIGITGQSGFIGSHLFNSFNLEKGIFQTIPFTDNYFSNPIMLNEWVAQCDIIIHLAGLMRHSDPQFIYDTNIKLVNVLIKALDKTKSRPHIIYSSSTQENIENHYGKSKRDGRLLLEKWAELNNAIYTGIILPNIFGPFGLPYFNSFIATFCHQLTHNEDTIINVDAKVKLLYIDELIEEIRRIIIERYDNFEYYVPHTTEKNVSEILNILKQFKTLYFENEIIPRLNDKFELDLFNTYRSFIDYESYFPRKCKKYDNIYGYHCEIPKFLNECHPSLIQLKPKVKICNKLEVNKFVRIINITGEAKIEIQRIGTNQVNSFFLLGNEYEFVDIPIWYSFCITNTGKKNLFIISLNSIFTNET